GLDKPDATVTVRVTGADGKTVEHVLHVVKPRPGTPRDRGHELDARVDKSDVLVELGGEWALALMAAPERFRDRTGGRAEGVDGVKMERGARKVTFALADMAWRMTEPVDAEAEGVELNEFLKAVAPLRADERVAEKPADLKPYGLDKPQA